MSHLFHLREDEKHVKEWLEGLPSPIPRVFPNNQTLEQTISSLIKFVCWKPEVCEPKCARSEARVESPKTKHF